MYFDFEDSRPDLPTIDRAISWREGVLISIIAHVAIIAGILAAPRLLPNDPRAARLRALLLQQADAPRFVFVQPRVDTIAPKPPVRADDSDQTRVARARERVPRPVNPLPFSRGNSPERVEPSQRQLPDVRAPDQGAAGAPPARLPDSTPALQLPALKPAPAPANAGGHLSAGALGDALRNLQRYVHREQFDNPQGGGGQPGASIQFDTKGVEFGPWIRRFVAQIRRNWFIPYAAMSMKGHVIITFNVHKDGTITDLAVVGPCPIAAFNNAAYGALASSNPTQPLPPEYPSDRAFFTVTFYYNEQPE